jgi:hypothetical protein
LAAWLTIILSRRKKSRPNDITTPKTHNKCILLIFGSGNHFILDAVCGFQQQNPWALFNVRERPAVISSHDKNDLPEFEHANALVSHKTFREKSSKVC